MKLINDLELTEKEFIELTIKWGFAGEEFDTKAWRERGCLKSNDGTHKKLFKKGKTRYDNVLLKGTGSNRIYTLSGLKETPTEKEDGRTDNGRNLTKDENEIIREYFFNQLSRRISHRENGWAETLNLWGMDWINELKVSESEWESYRKNLQDAFSAQVKITDEIIKKMILDIEENLKKNYRSLAEKSIEKLEKENRIETELEFYQVFAKGSYIPSMMQPILEADGKEFDYHQRLEGDKHLSIVEELSEFLEPFGMAYNRYKIVSAFPQYVVNGERETLKAANKWLKDEYSIDYMYSRIRIYVIDATMKMEISKDQVKEAFINRIIKNTNARMNRKDYKNTHKFQASFYRLSMFTLLHMKSVKGLKETIANEKLMIKEKFESCLYEYAIKYGESMETQQPEKITYRFGEEALTKSKPAIEMPFNVTEMFNLDPVEVAEYKEVKNMNKPEINPNLIDISLIGQEDDVFETEEPKEYKSFNDLHNELCEKFDGKKEKKAVLSEKLMPKTEEVNFSWGRNITELSLRGFDKWAK